MLKKGLFGMMILIVGVTLVFSLIGCDNGSGKSNDKGKGDGGMGCGTVTSRCHNNSTCQAGGCGAGYCTSQGCICP